MKIKALKSFAGKYTMAMGEVANVPDPIAKDLIKCKYAEKAERNKNEQGKIPKTSKCS